MQAAGGIYCLRHRSIPRLLSDCNWRNIGTAVSAKVSLREVCQPGAVE